MTIVITKDMTRKEIDILLKKLKPKQKLFNAKKYFGKFKWIGDPLEIQREWRDE
ncbi:MAG: hypothetical protein LH478_06280 [Chitinophagaceae bacterium]|nr:hypothetical protein [Chitinophagaceae bacterium]